MRQSQEKRGRVRRLERLGSEARVPGRRRRRWSTWAAVTAASVGWVGGWVGAKGG